MNKTTGQLICEAVLSEDSGKYLYEIEFVGDSAQTYDIRVKAFEIVRTEENRWIITSETSMWDVAVRRQEGLDKDGNFKAYTTDETKIAEYKRKVADVVITYYEDLVEKCKNAAYSYRYKDILKKYLDLREKLDGYR